MIVPPAGDRLNILCIFYRFGYTFTCHDSDHCLVRCSEASICDVCMNKWPFLDGAVNRYYACSKCGK